MDKAKIYLGEIITQLNLDALYFEIEKIAGLLDPAL
jgi:hypothetical protein